VYKSFEKYRVATQNPQGLAFSLTKKTSVLHENCPKYVFHPCEIHILAHLDITVLYTIYLWFKKILSLNSKPKRVCLRFYRQMSVHDKNGSKIYISSLEAHIFARLDIT
jgi:hypothetical protein